jgi:hypothetical protein
MDFDWEDEDTTPAPESRMSAWSAAAWVIAPLLLCLAMAAMLFFVLRPVESARQPIPVAGGPRLMPPTPPPDRFPEAPTEQNVPPGTPTLAPGLWYRAEMDRRLSDCYESFHEFYLIEQMAFHEPAMMRNEEWRSAAAEKVETFRARCELLGSMPSPPHGFTEIDSWLKLAAAEVGPAADNFTDLVEFDDLSALYRTIDHLSNFIEFTRNAESVLEQLGERKEL